MDNKIRLLRKAHGLTQKQLAEKMSISVRQLGYWEHGKGLSLEEAGRIADIFDCTIDELAGRDFRSPDPLRKKIFECCDLLNERGREQLATHAQIMVSSHMYDRTGKDA